MKGKFPRATPATIEGGNYPFLLVPMGLIGKKVRYPKIKNHNQVNYSTKSSKTQLSNQTTKSTYPKAARKVISNPKSVRLFKNSEQQTRLEQSIAKYLTKKI